MRRWIKAVGSIAGQATWLIAFLLVAQICVIVWMAKTSNFDPPPREPRHLGSPILEIELVGSAADAHAILRDPIGGLNRATMRGQIGEDWIFIAFYAPTFALLGFLLSKRRLPMAWAWATLAMVGSVAAAYFDRLENLGILGVLDTAPSDLVDAQADAIRRPSLIKWGLIAVVCLLLSALYPGRRSWDRWAFRAGNLAGLLLLIAGVLGLVGVAIHAQAIVWSTQVLSIGLLVAFPLHLLRPDRFLDREPPGRRMAQGDQVRPPVEAVEGAFDASATIG